MPLFNVTLKTGASKEELDKAKEQAKSQGGAIRHEYTLIKGFTYAYHHSHSLRSAFTNNTRTISVEYPEDHVQTLQTTDHIHVEQDGGVSTQ